MTTPDEARTLADRLDRIPLYDGSGEETDMTESAAAALRDLAGAQERAEAAEAETRRVVAEYEAAWVAKMRAQARAEAAEARVRELEAIINAATDAASAIYNAPCVRGQTAVWIGRREAASEIRAILIVHAASAALSERGGDA